MLLISPRADGDWVPVDNFYAVCRLILALIFIFGRRACFTYQECPTADLILALCANNNRVIYQLYISQMHYRSTKLIAIALLVLGAAADLTGNLPDPDQKNNESEANLQSAALPAQPNKLASLIPCSHMCPDDSCLSCSCSGSVCEFCVEGLCMKCNDVVCIQCASGIYSYCQVSGQTVNCRSQMNSAKCSGDTIGVLLPGEQSDGGTDSGTDSDQNQYDFGYTYGIVQPLAIGAIIGIVVGSLAGVALIILIVICVCRSNPQDQPIRQVSQNLQVYEVKGAQIESQANIYPPINEQVYEVQAVQIQNEPYNYPPING